MTQETIQVVQTVKTSTVPGPDNTTGDITATAATPTPVDDGTNRLLTHPLRDQSRGL